MSHSIAAGELWDIFTKECLLADVRPTNGVWDSWLKKAKAFQPKRSQIAIAVHLALIGSPLTGDLHGRARPN